MDPMQISDEDGNPHYDGEETQLTPRYPGFGDAIVHPGLFPINQDVADQESLDFAYPLTQDTNSGWGAGPQVSNPHQPSIHTAPPFVSRQTAIPSRQYHSESSAIMRARMQSPLLGPPPETYPGQFEPASMASNFNINSQSPWNLPYTPMETYDASIESPNPAAPSRTSFVSNVPSQIGILNTFPKESTRIYDHKTSDFHQPSRGTMVQIHQESLEPLLLERNRLRLIKDWLHTCPDASIFNPKHTASLATLMSIPVETVYQLFDKLVRSQFDPRLGFAGNTAVQTGSPLAVPIQPTSPAQDTSSSSQFAAVLRWVSERGQLCKHTSNLKDLVRKGNKIYQCTRGCGKAYVRKEDWVRHEFGINYPQEAWICTLPSQVSVDGILTCSSCEIENPGMDHDHLAQTPCGERAFKGRVFFREDHFMQHFKNMHPSIPVREQLAIAHFEINSQFPHECGFCVETEFATWRSWVSHIAKHFKDEGKDMRDWNLNRTGGPHDDGSSDSDDDDEDGHDDDFPDDMDDQGGTNNNGAGGGSGDPSSHGGASELPPNVSNSKFSGQLGKSNGTGNSSRNTYQQTSELNSVGSQFSSVQNGEGKQNLPSDNGIFDGLKAPSILVVAPSPGFRPLEKQSDSGSFQDSLSSSTRSISPMGQLVDNVGEVKDPPTSKFEDGYGSKYIESKVYKPSHSQFRETVKTLRSNITKKFHSFRKDVGHPRMVPSSPVSKATLSNETVSTIPNSGKSSFTAVSTLSSSLTLNASYLEQKLLDSRIRWGTHYFIPVDVLETIVTEQAIQEELQLHVVIDIPTADILPLSHTIRQKARKVFSILVFIGKGKLILSCLGEGVTDDHLPINFLKAPSQTSQGLMPMTRRNSQGLMPMMRNNDQALKPVKAFEGLSSRELDDFSRVQWYFLAPIFRIDRYQTKHYQLEDNCVMPYVEDTEHEARSGGFSDVWKVVIHSAHHNFLDSKTDASIAIKRLRSRKEDDFKHEADMLAAFSKNDHRHLIKLLGTYKYKGQYHFLFPFASSNLRQYWEQNEPCWSQEDLKWMLEQISGLASALNVIHNMRETVQPDPFLDPGDATQRYSRRLKVGTEKYGRHGDLKPDNILVFGAKSGRDGILQIADFGLGRFHRLESRSKIDPTSVGGSPTYVPPECALNLPISRKYDVWSLGCVFLEFVTWLLEGREGLERFGDDRMTKASDGSYHDSFYIVAMSSDTGTCEASVHPAVQKCIRGLHTHKRHSAFVHDLLDLIELDMLAVESQNRITSEKLSKKLEDFAAKAENKLATCHNRHETTRSVDFSQLLLRTATDLDSH